MVSRAFKLCDRARREKNWPPLSRFWLSALEAAALGWHNSRPPLERNSEKQTHSRPGWRGRSSATDRLAAGQSRQLLPSRSVGIESRQAKARARTRSTQTDHNYRHFSWPSRRHRHGHNISNIEAAAAATAAARSAKQPAGSCQISTQAQHLQTAT